MINYEQFKNNLQIIVGAVGGYLAARFQLSNDLVLALGGAFMSFAPLIWGYIDNRTQALVAKANAAGPVAGVVMKDTAEGRAIADAIPAKTVAVSGSEEAVSVAKNGEK